MRRPDLGSERRRNRNNRLGSEIVPFPRTSPQITNSLSPEDLQILRFAHKLQSDLTKFRAQKLKEAALARVIASRDLAAWLKYKEWREVEEGGNEPAQEVRQWIS